MNITIEDVSAFIGGFFFVALIFYALDWGST
jgi:hypothetical protein